MAYTGFTDGETKGGFQNSGETFRSTL